MPEIETQLRDYFDAAVERVVVEDVVARQRVVETGASYGQARLLRPAWAAAAAFAGTFVVLGGSLVVGSVVRRPAIDVGSGGLTEALSEATDTNPASLLLIATIAVAIALVGALIVKNQVRRTRKEETMANTMEAPTIELPEAAERTNRRLVWVVVGLALGLIALGAWALYNQATEPEAAPPAAVVELLDDYHAAWNNHDGDAFNAVTTDDYEYTSGDGTFARNVMANTIRGIEALREFRVGIVGDPVATATTPDYVAVVSRLESTNVSGVERELNGISTFVVVETDAGLKIAEHRFVGNDQD